ncbi:PRC-barrel domain-containing protein [Acetivibrio clariflavus]|uniref:PRC-barrel domain-containing protein n=1 Tax=Acetivibrio clariflavus TaxID=288965 RepID=UPI0004B4FD1E|nr:PRC-barrel domain-containing protein [Acetivibrio clariflavus]
MKKAQDIIGLPIISIYDGIEVGRVKNIIINATKRAIEYLIIDSGIQFLSAKIVPTVNVLGIGEYAVTIENESVISYVSEIPAAIELLQKNIQVTGTKLLTKKGRLIGEVGDIYVDEDDNCSIVGLEYIYDGKVKIIPRTSIISISKDFVVVIEEVEESLIDKKEELENVVCLQDDEKDRYNPHIDQNSDFVENSGDEIEELIIEETDSSYEEIDVSYPDFPFETNISVEEVLDLSLPENDELNYEDFFADIDDNYLESGFNDNGLDETFFEGFEDLEGGYLEEDLKKDEKSINIQLLTENIEKEINEKENIEKESTDKVNTEKNSDDKKEVWKPSFVNFDKEKTSGSSLDKSSAAHLFEQRQKEYLNGRKATKTIISSSGTVIIRQGEIITDEVIELSRQNGKLIELIMNNEA